MKKITVIIQARLGSTRLPGKTLMTVCGKSLLEHLIERVKSSKLVNRIILATTIKEQDRAIVEIAKKNGLLFYRGSENDVLDRFYRTSIAFNAKIIVRVTPDCPILDPRVMDLVISNYIDGDYDYVSNTINPTYPDGLDVEVFSFKALKKAWADARLASEREHVTAYIVKHPELFRILNVRRIGIDLSHMRWTVDTQYDLDFIRKIFSLFQKEEHLFFMEDVLKALEENPDLMKINKKTIRNEGYLKSLREDKVISKGEARNG